MGVISMHRQRARFLLSVELNYTAQSAQTDGARVAKHQIIEKEIAAYRRRKRERERERELMYQKNSAVLNENAMEYQGSYRPVVMSDSRYNNTAYGYNYRRFDCNSTAL